MGVFSAEKKEMTHGAVDSVIGGKAKFKGELTTQGAVSVNGEFFGKISSGGEVILSHGAKIVGDIVGANVVISGKVDGNVTSAQSLEITKNGQVNGDLCGGKIIIDEGAVYQGKVTVNYAAKTSSQDEEEIVVEDNIPQNQTSKASLF